MAQQPLKDFGLPLIRVSLSNLIQLYLFPTRGRVICNKNHLDRAKVLLGCEYAD